MKESIGQKTWVISVNMGYGHQRTAYPLKKLAFKGKIIHANSYQGILKRDRMLWEQSRKFYEFISNFKRVPLIGEFSFSVYNQFQKILSFYPKRDLSKPNFSLKRFYSLFKKGWGKDLIEKLKKESIPLISTFFIPAFMAEFFNYPGEIFCVVCDADIARPWAPLEPFSSKIKYFAPTERVVERLKLYGVKKENIFLTGYPLPLENIGSENLEILKHDLAERLLILDPQRKYFQRYQPLIKRYLGKLPKKPSRPLTVMFAIGGAGAQKEIGFKILKSLREKIRTKKVKIILVAGIRKWIKDYFLKHIKDLDLEGVFGDNIEIIFNKNIEGYFKDFNLALRKTDILWTKPSELSFYTALGLPIIIAPSIGSQEDFNREWLLRLGSAILERNPNYTDEWLFDLLKSGWFAEAAMQGFIEGEKRGVFNIKKIIS
ncbi:MAG: DUF6938 domain-containing protein [Candidatus Nealsonbacteria bacterium]